MTGMAVGAAVGTVAGGVEGYAHGGAQGMVEGAAKGMVVGGLMGGLGAGAAVVGGGAGLLLGASGLAFGVGTAADAFTMYKQPTLENGLVLLGDLVVLFGARAVEAQTRGARELEATRGPEPERCASGKEPIDFASGAMFFTQVDVELPGYLPFRWACTYYSTSARQGPLGYGWHHSYDLALWPDATYGTVAIRLGDGRLAVFDAPSAENEFYSYYRARQLELRPAPDGSDGYAMYSVRERCTYHFVPSPAQPGQYHLLAIEDGYGHALTFAYTSQGHLVGIIDSVGRAIGVRTDASGRILALDLPRPDGTPGSFAAVEYGYDAQGHLTSRTNAEGHTRHFRYAGRRLVQKTFATGMSFYYEYDEHGRCTRTWGDENYYNGRLVYAPHCTTVYTDDPQAVDTYYHEQGLVTSHINALGHTHHWRYNQHLELEEGQDALGHTTRYTYDARGNVTSVTYPDGAMVRTQYNQHDQPAVATDANGHQWEWRYDERGELVERTDPTGASTTYRYNEQGQLVEAVNALGHSTHLRYDQYDNIAHIVRLNGAIYSRLYDQLGRLLELTDAAGNKQRRQYDRAGQLVSLQEPSGRQLFLTYDGEANVVRAKDGEQEVEFDYTIINRLARRRQAGQEVRFAYDREARLIGVTNERNQQYRFVLDAVGRVLVEESFDGLVRRYERDAEGQVIKVLRPENRSTSYTYNEVRKLTAVAYSDGTREEYAYDAVGALLEARNDEATIYLTRDPLGRVIREMRGSYSIDQAYDRSGQRTSLSSSLGATLQVAYDALGGVASMAAGPWQADFLRDAQGLEIQRRLSGLQTSWQRDATGRPIEQQVLARNGDGRQRQYSWRGADRLTEITDSLTGYTHFDYNAFGCLTASRYADGTTDLRLPDLVGNLFRAASQQDRAYGPGGRLLGADGTTYHYDAEGNLLKKRTAAGQVWQYQWSGAGRLQAVIRPDGYAVYFTYDALGRRLSKQYRGRTTHWLWDGDKPLHEWTTLELDGRADNAADVITWLFEENTFAPLAKLAGKQAYNIVADHLGTPLEMYDSTGQKRWLAQLDGYGAVRQGRGAAQDCPFRQQGQYEDVETGLYYNRFRYYDPAIGLYISQDPAKLQGGAKLYSYVDNPNAQIDPYGLFPGPGFFSDLKWSGMGHHTVPRAHATAHGLDNLGTKRNSPTWYPYESEVPGSAKIHHDAHLALDQHNVPFNPGAPNANNPGSQTELLSRARTAYQDPALTQKGILRIPSTGEVVADNVTIAEAMEKALEWSAKQPTTTTCP
jgi:RHS repeat-associated protein